MKKVVIASLAIVAIFACMISCSKSNSATGDNPSACDGVSKNFANDVNPLIQTFCNQAACHNAGSTNGPGPLTNYTEVFNARVRIREQVQAGLMPQNTSLTTAQQNTIICWIDNGAPNN
jgi:hypothetical protein